MIPKWGVFVISNDIIENFDAFLNEKKANFECIAIGGISLIMMGVITRNTRDCDILDPEIPQNILSYAKEFAEKSRKKGLVIRDDWFNNGPSSLVEHLPDGWRNRTKLLFRGKALTLYTLGRQDLLKTKLFALCDRGTDHADCVALKPTVEELNDALPWVQFQDANPDWPKHVKEVFGSLAKELGYELQ